ncbi:DUF2868 domain-containing protein [Thiohalocapsa halophila]|nr:DUF2868 domain-containing protein [Thiohalocapsa halophila]
MAEPDTSRWRLPDLLDFDYYVDRDEQRMRQEPAERKHLAERDRRLYRERIAPRVKAPEHTPAHRSAALRRWLGIRRGSEDASIRALLPGSAFARGQRLVAIALAVLGFLGGVGVASALLHYEGDQPVNVSWYVFVLVILQVLLLIATAVAWYARRSHTMQTAVQDFSLVGHLLKPLFGAAARWVQHQRLAHVPPDVREHAKARKGLLSGHFSLYGPAAYLPMLIPAQLFGIGFNVGVILTTVALEWFTDMAFGWGSALDVQPGTIHTLAHIIALPWSWLFGDGLGVPTLEQVQGTRISLKDPLFIMDAEHLRSWRWFLVLAVFTYGLLPRLVLLGLSLLTVRRTLAALPFTHQRTQALYARMITPQLETAGGTGHGPEMPIPGPLSPMSGPRAAPRAQPVSPAPAPPAKPPAAQQPSAVPDEAAPTPPKPAPRPAAKPPARKSGSAPAAKAAPAPKPAAAEPRAEHGGTAKADKAPAAAGGASAPREQAKAPSQPSPAAKRTPEPSKTPPLAAKRAPTTEPALRSAPPPAAAAAKAKGALTIAPDACLLLMHVDVADVLDDSDHERLQRLLHGHSGWRVAGSATFGGGSTMAKQALTMIKAADWQAPPPRVALLSDGSQPPITETLRFLRAVRAAAGEHAQLLLVLVGDPDGDDPLPPLSPFEFQDWQSKLEQLGDPYLRLEMLAGPAEETD